MPAMKSEKLKECLDDFGFDEKEKAEIMQCYENDDTRGIIRLLRRHRQTALDKIHTEEKQISCLDYLIFQLENETQTH